MAFSICSSVTSNSSLIASLTSFAKASVLSLTSFVWVMPLSSCFASDTSDRLFSICGARPILPALSALCTTCGAIAELFCICIICRKSPPDASFALVCLAFATVAVGIRIFAIPVLVMASSSFHMQLSMYLSHKMRLYILKAPSTWSQPQPYPHSWLPEYHLWIGHP